LRGNKFLEWDGGVRVNAAIYWAKGFLKGTRTEQVTGFVDMMPTIAEIVGAQTPPRPWDGISIASVLNGSCQRIERDMFLGGGAAVNGNHKMVLAGRNSAMGLDEDFLAYYPDDKYEAENHIADHPAESARLREFILSFDSIEPAFKELPFNSGKEGFVPPKEWGVTKP
jgi:arylsulfatase B